MTLVGKIIKDPDTESLISKYLKAGVMVKGKYEATYVGTPQGGNLSPILIVKRDDRHLGCGKKCVNE